MCTKPFSQTKNKGKLFLVAKSSGPLLARLPLKVLGPFRGEKGNCYKTCNFAFLSVPVYHTECVAVITHETRHINSLI